MTVKGALADPAVSFSQILRDLRAQRFTGVAYVHFQHGQIRTVELPGQPRRIPVTPLDNEEFLTQ